MENEEIKSIITEDDKQKVLSRDSFPIDINLIEVPLFLYQVDVEKELPSVKELLKTTSSKHIKKLLKGVTEESINSKVNVVSWTDSKGFERMLIGMSMYRMPDGFSMSVLLALIKLFIEKKSPIIFDNEQKKYLIEDRKVSFSLYEMCRTMNLPIKGESYARIEAAIGRLRKADYYSIASGSFYDKENKKYKVDYIDSIKLLEKVKSTNKETKTSREDKWEVTIGENIISNIENNFIRFLNESIFFSIKGELARRLYLYIEGNKYNASGKTLMFIKRSYEVLGKKIPLYFKYPSKFKERVAGPLKQLKDRGIISDYFFGDEVHVNGKKDKSLYIIFNGTAGSIIEFIESKNVKEEIAVDKIEEKKEYVFPVNANEELLKLGVSEDAIVSINSKFDRYTIAKHLLYIKDKMNNGTAKNPAALFVFGLQMGKVDIERSAPEICKFVNDYKKEIDKKENVSHKKIDDAFIMYRNNALEDFKANDLVGYEMLADAFINPAPQAIKNIENFTRIFNITEDKEERKKLNQKIRYWEDVRDNGYLEEDFKDKLFNEYIAYSKMTDTPVMDKEAFKNKYISENK